ncbi:MAG: hypothetical protein J1G30_05710 [Spirochaetales bacterium]|nr:hypothetical protein [Spirochaetales bacterium]
MKIKISTVFFILCISFIHAENLPQNDAIAQRIKDVLLESYDNYEGFTFQERLVLKFGKRTFIDCVTLWCQNYTDIENIDIKLHYQLKKLSDKVFQYESREKAEQFKKALEELTFLGFCNIDLYYRALLKTENLPEMFTTDDIDDALANPEFFLLKKQLYKKEETLKQEIRSHLTSKECKNKLGIYLFFFDFVNKIRVGIIKKDIEKSYKAILEKQKNSEINLQ